MKNSIVWIRLYERDFGLKFHSDNPKKARELYTLMYKVWDRKNLRFDLE